MYTQPYYDYTARTQRLNDISTINANGRYFQKLDLISVLTINSSYTFNVYRRYNSDYNIVVEDCYGNLSFHQDESLHTTLKNRCALSDVELSSIYVSYFYSFKHNTVLNYIPCSIFTMKWSDIQDKYSAVDMALNYQPVSSAEQEVQTDHSVKDDVNDPSVKSEESSEDDSEVNSEENSEENSEVSDVSNNESVEEKSYEPVMYLASLFSCPACPPPFANVIVNLQPVTVCNNEDDCCIRICKKRSFCNMNDESESEDVEESSDKEEEEEEKDEEDEEEEEENENESNYTILRNGTKFRKKN